MTNILFDCPNEGDFYEELKEYIPADGRVCVVALSYYDDAVYDAESWGRIHGPGGGIYEETVAAFATYGIPKESITFINYFSDTKTEAEAKIAAANILYFPGGLPDRMMERIEEMNIAPALQAHRGLVMGYSAGAVIQLDRYHLTPDADYSEFGYYHGLGYLSGFAIEVHYEGRVEQDASIARVCAERGLPVYVTHTGKGGIVVTNSGIRTVGKVDIYQPTK
jgi:hypothetical protein